MERRDIAADSAIEEQEPRGGLIYKIARLLVVIVSAPFWAIRELYWFLDTDAAVRANGVETTGAILKTATETRTETGGEFGDTTVTEHFVTYRYQTPDGSHTARKKVQGLGGLEMGTEIVVYYRPPTDRPVNQKDSALDWCPRVAHRV